MGSTLTSRQKQAIKTKNRIFDVTLSLMDKHGFDSVNIEDICKAAEVSIGTFYYYYKSKNDVFFELYERADKYFEHTVNEEISASNSIDKIIEYLDYYARYCEMTGIQTMTLMMNAANTNFIKKGRYMQKLLMEIIQKGKDAGEIAAEPSSAEICEHLFIFIRGILFDWCLHRGKYNLRKRVAHYMTPIVHTFRNR